MGIVFIELYSLIPLLVLVALAIFQGHSCGIKQLKMKLVFLAKLLSSCLQTCMIYIHTVCVCVRV